MAWRHALQLACATVRPSNKSIQAAASGCGRTSAHVSESGRWMVPLRRRRAASSCSRQYTSRVRASTSAVAKVPTPRAVDSNSVYSGNDTCVGVRMCRLWQWRAFAPHTVAGEEEDLRMEVGVRGGGGRRIVVKRACSDGCAVGMRSYEDLGELEELVILNPYSDSSVSSLSCKSRSYSSLTEFMSVLSVCDVDAPGVDGNVDVGVDGNGEVQVEVRGEASAVLYRWCGLWKAGGRVYGPGG